MGALTRRILLALTRFDEQRLQSLAERRIGGMFFEGIAVKSQINTTWVVFQGKVTSTRSLCLVRSLYARQQFDHHLTSPHAEHRHPQGPGLVESRVPLCGRHILFTTILLMRGASPPN